MPSRMLTVAHRTFRWLTVGLTVGMLGMVTVGVLQEASPVDAFLVRRAPSTPWKALPAEQVLSGATIPPSANVVFHLPEEFTTIQREILLGHRGQDVRYWGYCLPENYAPEVVKRRSGLPGLLFLSEKERMIRRERETVKEPVFNLQNLPTPEQIQRIGEQDKGIIRHQVETFEAGMLCYIMTEAPLSIGLDPDMDQLNDKLEREVGTNPNVQDSDADGIIDGTEFLRATSPTLRDTDSDGLIDGIEDANWNGRSEAGETDPRVKDSDRDGLCDGMCRMRLSNGQQVFAGEDKNLNGTVDSGESDPRKYSTKGDRSNDFLNYLRCLADNKTTC